MTPPASLCAALRSSRLHVSASLEVEPSLKLLPVLLGQDCCLTYPAEEETKEGTAFVALQDGSHELLLAAEGTQASTHRAPGTDDHLMEEIGITLCSEPEYYLLCAVFVCCELRAVINIVGVSMYAGFQVEHRGAGIFSSMNRPERLSAEQNNQIPKGSSILTGTAKLCREEAPAYCFASHDGRARDLRATGIRYQSR